MKTKQFVEKLRSLADQLEKVLAETPELQGTLQFQYFSLPCVPVVYFHLNDEQLQVNLPIDTVDGRHLHLCFNTGFGSSAPQEIAEPGFVENGENKEMSHD